MVKITRADSVSVSPNEALAYAISVALFEAAARGWLSQKRAGALQDRTEELYNALLTGQVLVKQENGLYTIEPFEGDDETLVIEG